jgi:peptidoglycan hydrolase CwlO-like protein
VENDVKRLTDVAIKNSNIKKEIKSLFDKLAKITSEYETHQEEFKKIINNSESSVN